MKIYWQKKKKWQVLIKITAKTYITLRRLPLVLPTSGPIPCVFDCGLTSYFGEFDISSIADRLRTVNWSNYSHPTGVVNRFTGPPSHSLQQPCNQKDINLKIDHIVILKGIISGVCIPNMKYVSVSAQKPLGILYLTKRDRQTKPKLCPDHSIRRKTTCLQMTGRLKTDITCAPLVSTSKA